MVELVSLERNRDRDLHFLAPFLTGTNDKGPFLLDVSDAIRCSSLHG